MMDFIKTQLSRDVKFFVLFFFLSPLELPKNERTPLFTYINYICLLMEFIIRMALYIGGE